MVFMNVKWSLCASELIMRTIILIRAHSQYVYGMCHYDASFFFSILMYVCQNTVHPYYTALKS